MVAVADPVPWPITAVEHRGGTVLRTGPPRPGLTEGELRGGQPRLKLCRQPKSLLCPLVDKDEVPPS